MKFLHTSDLHLGIRLCEYGLLADCRHILSEIAETAVRENCAAVVIAGDIYDRSNPSADAVAVFDEFVSALAGHEIAVLAISGNHDSPERVAYLSSVTRSAGVYFSPVYKGTSEKITFTDAFGQVNFYLLPFVKPVNVRAVCEDFDGDSYTDAVSHAIQRMNADENERNVLVTHQFVVPDAGEETPEVGGTGAVRAEVFHQFDYTALGHLHTAHAAADGVYYAGSPLKYSFTEVADEKSVYLVDLREKGEMSVERVVLHPLHDLREIRGTYEEVVSRGLRDPMKEDYIRVILTDEEDVTDAVAKLRCVYPNLMRLSYDNLRTRGYREIDGTICDAEEDGAMTPESVFAALYEMQNNVPPDDGMMAVVRDIFKACMMKE